MLPVLKTYWPLMKDKHTSRNEGYSVTTVGLSNRKMSIRVGVSECPFLSTFFCLWFG